MKTLQCATKFLPIKLSFVTLPKKTPKLECRKLADIYKIRNTAAANIFKNEKKICEQHEMFCEKSKKRNHHGKYHKINEILFEWYKRCCASNVNPNGITLKEEVMGIKEQLQNSDFDDFSTSDGWLDFWRTTYSVKNVALLARLETCLQKTVTSCMERINELIEGYSLENIWKYGRSWLFF